MSSVISRLIRLTNGCRT